MDIRTHRNRKDLIGEHKIGDAGQAISAVIFAIVWGADSFFFGFSTQLNDIVPNIIRAPAGGLVLIASGYLSMSGLRIVFSEVRGKPEIIKKGVFSIVRHPVYLGEILVYLGLLCFSISIASAAVWVLAIGFLYYISRYEEKILLEYFGEEYRTYMKEVPMWLPKISNIFK